MPETEHGSGGLGKEFRLGSGDGLISWGRTLCWRAQSLTRRVYPQPRASLSVGIRMNLSNLYRLLAITALALLAACASDRASGVPDTGGRDVGSFPDANEDAPDALSDAAVDVRADAPPLEGVPRLEFVADQEQALAVNQRTELEVLFLGANDEPVADAQLGFSYDEIRAGGSQLRSLTARTGSDGIASVELVAGTVPAEFDVEVTVRNDEEIRPITFYVTVTPKDSADYLIQVIYPDAAIALQEIDVFLFNSDGGCADIPRDPDEVFGALDQIDIFPLADGTIPETPYEANRADIPLTYAVAVGSKEDTAVAMGCTDGLPLDVENGSNTLIEIELLNLFPDIMGEFRVVNEFDLLEFIPGTAQDVVRYIGSFFESPGHTVFDILEDFDVFDGEDLPFGLGDLIADAIDALLFEFLPPEAVAVFESGADIYDTLQNIQLQGSMIFFENADERGRLSDCNEIILDEIIVEFDTFDTPTFNLRSYGYQGAYGTFTGWISIEDEGGIDYKLNIQHFGLEINYGELAVFILETIVFPSVIGPEVDSMEAFVESFIDCEAIAEDVGWGVIESLCDTIIGAAVDGLRDFLTDQTADVGSYYILATPGPDSDPPEEIELLEEGMEWAPCDLGLETGGGDFQVELLGGPGRDRCVWDSRFRTDADDPVGEAVPAAFDGFRLSTRASGTCGDGE